MREGDTWGVIGCRSGANPDPIRMASVLPHPAVAFRFVGSEPLVFEDGTFCDRKVDGRYETGWYFIRSRIFDYLDPEAIKPLTRWAFRIRQHPIRGMIKAAMRRHKSTHLIVLAPGQFYPFRPDVDQLEPKYY